MATINASTKARRSRNGCWTCKRRRKKCDNTGQPCRNCQRLNLKCETGVRLVWEDDARREGMSRRGPSKTNPTNCNISYTTQLSQWSSFNLSQSESTLLDSYIQRFSRTYPAFCGPENPFLSIFIPLSLRYRVVLDSLLALSSVQNWTDGAFEMEHRMLHFRHKALQGCVRLTGSMSRTAEPEREHRLQTHPYPSPSPSTSKADDNTLALLASCVLLLLCEKLSSGDQAAATPHLQFFSRLFPVEDLLSIVNGNTWTKDPWPEALRFLSSLFLYNDLVRSTSSHIPTLSGFYLGALTGMMSPIPSNSQPQQISYRFSLPSLVARCSAGDLSVTDEEIFFWDGRLDWFPSYALVHQQSDTTGNTTQERLPTADPGFVLNPAFHHLDSFTFAQTWSEEALTRELYRIAATVYRKQCVLESYIRTYNPTALFTITLSNIQIDQEMGNLPSWAVQLLQLLPDGSSWENCLLWPIGIVSKELNTIPEREYITNRLQILEKRFGIRLYCIVREQLVETWARRDGLRDGTGPVPVLCG